MGCGSSAETTTDITCHGGDEKIKDFHDHYEVHSKIGQGTYARIYSVTEKNFNSSLHSNRTSSTQKAVKVTLLQDERRVPLDHMPKKHNVFNEARVWKHVGRHQNCVRLFETFYNIELCYMVMEKCCTGLGEHLTQVDPLNERTLGDVFLQMLCGIAHIHSIEVVHRDIKMDNFMVGGEDGNTVKLGDFGFSVLISQEATLGGKLVGIFGTAPYMCPEMVCGHGYNEKADIWSFGVIVYALLFGTFPYYDSQEKSAESIKRAIMLGRPPTFAPKDTCSERADYRSEDAVAFARKLLNRRPEQRASAAEALDTSYMTAIKHQSHALGEDLPSLYHMVHTAQRICVLKSTDCVSHTTIDHMVRTRSGRSQAQFKMVGIISEECNTETKLKLADSIGKHKGSPSQFSNNPNIVKGPGASCASTAPSENGVNFKLFEECHNDFKCDEYPLDPLDQRPRCHTDFEATHVIEDIKPRSFTL